MADAGLSGIDFARHERSLARMLGQPVSMLVCTASGVAWPADGVAHARLGGQLPAAPADGGVRRIEFEQGGVSYFLALMPEPTALSLGVLLHDAVAESQPQFIEESLRDVAEAIRVEVNLQRELNAIADELAARYEELHVIYSADRRLADCGPHTDVLQQVLEDSAVHLNIDVAAFVSPRHKLALHASNLSGPIHNLDLVLVELRGDLFRFLSASRQAVVLNAANDPRRAYLLTDMPYKVVACPVFEGNVVTAALVALNHAHKPDFTNSDRNLCEVLANQLSGLMHVVGLVKSLSVFTEQMAAALIESVEAKDPYTRGHSERVHHLSMEIGRAMALSAEEMDNLHWGALLHDVGKIGIPDAVLCKPARLTPDEYAFIMVHPERSYEILRHVDRLQGALPGARHHQEKFDGTGYPHGLKGSNIPLLARVIAVADTYDSITSSRAYRAGRSHEFALQEILRVAGTQLDPEIVKVFRDLCAGEPEWLQRFSVRREEIGV